MKLDHKTILVTGAAGFIGAFLSQAILKEHESVHVVGIDSMNDYYEVSLKEYRLKELEKTEPAPPKWEMRHGYSTPLCARCGASLPEAIRTP